MIVAELIPITSSILTESLSYFSATEISPGTIVTIPLRKQEIKGIVISTSNVKNIKQNLRNQSFKIRNIIKSHDKTIFSSAYLKTIGQLKNYYVLPAGKLIDITYPKYITKNFEEFCVDQAKLSTPLKNQNFQRAVLQKEYSQRIEYYKKLIKENLERDSSLQIICPTVLGVKKFGADLKSLFPKQTHLLHGKTSKTKLKKIYKEITSQPSIIISTVHFVDIPAQNKSTIVLENDSSSYYYRAAAPHIDLRVFVEEYAKKANLKLIFADSILRPERFNNLNEQNINMDIFSAEKISIVSAFNKKPLKQTDRERIIDLTKKSEFSPFSDELLKYIKESVRNKERMFFYTRRKSLAPSISCNDCGKLARDPRSQIPYSLYKKQTTDETEKSYIYLNRVTGEQIPAFDSCQYCKSWRLQTLGIGTETIEEELQRQFPKIKTHVIDSIHTKTETEIKKILKKFNSEKGEAIALIGTQKALPYLEDIDTSYIVSIDGFFNQMSFSNELQILILVKKIYDATSNHTYLQTRNAPKKKNPKGKLTNKETLRTKDPLQIKFAKKIQEISKNMLSIKDIGKHMSSRYTESLGLWDVLKTGNYSEFTESHSNKKTVIKINHLAKRDELMNLENMYKKIFEKYNPYIKKRGSKGGLVNLSTILIVENNLWNPKNQDLKLYQKLPFGERNIDIEINPILF